MIASRESRLALWQAEHVRTKLLACFPGCQIEILGLTTRGDRILDRTLSKVGGKGLFVKELEAAIEQGRADLAVHSLKDVPMELPPGFALAAVLAREDPRDAFISNDYLTLEQLPAGAIIGTSSLRRQAVIAARFPWLKIKPLRGNLDTRLSKLDKGDYAAIILAAAGLRRLGLERRITALLEPEQCLPAPGQGALALEIRTDRSDLQEMLTVLHHVPTAQAVMLERALSRAFGGSCQIPLAAYATTAGDQMRLRAMISTPDGKRMAMADISAPVAVPEALEEAVVKALKAQHADTILALCAQNNSASESL